MKGNLTKHEADLKAKELLGKFNEELDATGQESETKAAKWVIEKGKEDNKKEDEKRAIEQEKLHKASKKGQVLTYKDAIYNALKRQMIESYSLLPRGFIWYPVKSKKGIVIYIRDLDNQWYARGMTLSTNPMYDLNCIDRLVDQALNHMDKLEAEYETRLKKVETEIILPK